MCRRISPANGKGQRRGCSCWFSAAGCGRKIRNVVGHIVHERTSGETIRDTYGDYITDDAGKVTYFEPGVLASLDAESVEHDLKLWAEYSDSDGGMLDDVIPIRPTPKSRNRSF